MALTKPRENSTENKSPHTHFQLSLTFLNTTDLKSMHHEQFLYLSKLKTVIINCCYSKTKYKMNIRK